MSRAWANTGNNHFYAYDPFFVVLCISYVCRESQVLVPQVRTYVGVIGVVNL